MKEVRNGFIAFVFLLAFYILVNYAAAGYEGVIWNLRGYWMYVFPISAGFGLQIALYTHIKSYRESCKSIATGGISAGSMVACCLHHVTDAVPLLGVGISYFLTLYTEFFLLIGVLSSVVGVVWMLSTIQKNALFEDSSFLAKIMFVDYEKLKIVVLIFSVLIAAWKYSSAPWGVV